MALKVEVIVDGGMHAEEALGGSSRFETAASCALLVAPPDASFRARLFLLSPLLMRTVSRRRPRLYRIRGAGNAAWHPVFSSELRVFCAVSILLGLVAIAEGRLSTLSVIAAITVSSSIAAVPVTFAGFGRRAIAVTVPPRL
jgi:hypothetical protein